MKSSSNLPVSRFFSPLFSLFYVSLLILPGYALAQSLSIKPGLWEHTMTMKSETGQLEQALEQARQMLAAMPEAQRAMMENMMAEQGINFDFANQSFQNCV